MGIMLSKLKKILIILAKAFAFIVCAVIMVVIGILISMYADEHWLPTTAHEEMVRVKKLSGVGFESGPTSPSSKSFNLELSSGLEEEVAFPGDADIIVGKTYHLSYSRTKLYRVIIVKNYTLTHEGSENGTAPHENKGDK